MKDKKFMKALPYAISLIMMLMGFIIGLYSMVAGFIILCLSFTILMILFIRLSMLDLRETKKKIRDDMDILHKRLDKDSGLDDTAMISGQRVYKRKR